MALQGDTLFYPTCLKYQAGQTLSLRAVMAANLQRTYFMSTSLRHNYTDILVNRYLDRKGINYLTRNNQINTISTLFRYWVSELN